MKLKVARFAPPGVNRATSGFLKNMGPYGAHSGIHYISPKPMGKCYLSMEINYFRGFISKNPQTKTVKVARFAPSPPMQHTCLVTCLKTTCLLSP